MMKIGDPVTSYTDPCGCVWRNGKWISVCAEHMHKDGIKPAIPRTEYIFEMGTLR